MSDLTRTQRRAKLSVSTIAAVMGALLFCATDARAQSTAEDLDKYWAMRDRVRSEFTVAGSAAGQSIPATYRNTLFSFIKWSDGTVQLGWHIGVLATEHAMLADAANFPGYDQADLDALTRNETELHDALAALERLDNGAEAAFLGCLQLNLINGFFIRDDVPADFHTNFPAMSASQSDFSDIAPYNKEMSQDQVYHLLLGLALVKRFVPTGVVVGTRDLRAWAIEQAARIVDWVALDDWIIKNPVCGKDVDRGADAHGYAKGCNLAIGFITDGAISHTVGAPYEAAWDTLSSSANPVYLNEDNLHMAMVLAAIGKGFGDSTLDDLVALAALQNWYLYPLLHAALHEPGSLPSWTTHAAAINGYADTALGELPAGAAPASPLPGGPAVHGWTTENRYIRPLASHYAGGDGSDGQAYHGLDFQLLHNLYYLVTPSAWDFGGTGDIDAGVPGIVDAGAPGAPDSGLPADAAANTPDATIGGGQNDGGCGCRATGDRDEIPGALLIGMLLLAILPRPSWATTACARAVISAAGHTRGRSRRAMR